MKFIALALAALLVSGPASADEAKPKAEESAKNTCGKTVEECQKAFDEQTAKLAVETKAYIAVRQQRDSAQQAASDMQIQDYLDVKK